MKKTERDLLLLLASKGGATHSVKATTVSLAKELRAPQQTISRWLSSLEKSGLSEKTPQGLRISPKGLESLEREYQALKSVFSKEKKNEVFLEGIAVSGFGDGAYYLSREGYKRQFKEKLGFEPFPGTLNIKLSGASDLESAQKMHSAPGIQIEEFSGEGRKFGKAKCFKAEINGVRGAVIIPQRSHYGREIVEIASPENLRKKLSLKEGSEIVAKVEL